MIHKPLKSLSLTVTLGFLIVAFSISVHAQQPYIGEVVLVPYNFAPLGWAFCEGQLLPIAQYDALFSLIGTTFGGDGQVIFGLPDYRSRFPLSAGQGPGLSNYTLGEQAGVESITLTSNQMPVHTHAVNADSTAGTSKSPKNALPAADAGKIPQYGSNARTLEAATEVAPTGGSQPHSILKPFTTLHWIIALEGIYPPRFSQSDKKTNDEIRK